MSDVLRFSAQQNSSHNSSRRDVDVRELILEICASLAWQMETQQIVIDMDVPFGERLPLDRNMLRQAILQIVLHAMESMPKGGELSFFSCNSPQCYELEIADTGPGLSRDARRQLAASSSHETAHVLSPVVRMLKVHGAEIRAENCPLGGAAMTLRVPRHTWEAEAAA